MGNCIKARRRQVQSSLPEPIQNVDSKPQSGPLISEPTGSSSVCEGDPQSCLQFWRDSNTSVRLYWSANLGSKMGTGILTLLDGQWVLEPAKEPIRPTANFLMYQYSSNTGPPDGIPIVQIKADTYDPKADDCLAASSAAHLAAWALPQSIEDATIAHPVKLDGRFFNASPTSDVQASLEYTLESLQYKGFYLGYDASKKGPTYPVILVKDKDPKWPISINFTASTKITGLIC
ncbi:uncharacterized protein [Amphiura filiformis]|uniref:uncharacterized protein n=1 Tax=Amphiura filiformis TaxID=82378 RepID=UPI003B213BC1